MNTHPKDVIELPPITEKTYRKLICLLVFALALAAATICWGWSIKLVMGLWAFGIVAVCGLICWEVK
jgi:hypothetical protein